MLKILMCVMLFAMPLMAKNWTVLLWLNADNSLESFAQLNIDQIKSIIPVIDSEVDIVAMIDKSEQGDSKYVHFNAAGIADDELAVGEVDGGNYQELVKFIKWTVEKYPSDKYFLDIWDHGSGAEPMLGKDSFKLFDVSIDESSGNVIKTNDFHKIFEEILPIHINVLGYDACLMQMVETLYEVKDYVDVAVASEHTEAGAGWDYSKMFPALKDKFQEEDFAKSIVESYAGVYVDDDSTMSAVSLAKFKEFLPLFKEWALSVDSKIFKKAKKNAISFAIADNKDLGQILKNSNASEELLNAYNSMVIDSKGTSYYTEVTGVAIYAPNYSVAGWYGKLDFISEYPEYLELLKK